MLFGRIFTTFAAFATTIGLYHRGIISGPSFSNRSMRTEGHVVDIFELPFTESVYVGIEFDIDSKKWVKEMPRYDIWTAGRAPRIGDQILFCYSPNDVEDIAIVSGNKFTCAPPDAITSVAIYIVHTLKFLAIVCAAFLAFSFPEVSTGLLVLGTLIYLVSLGISGNQGTAIFFGVSSGMLVLLVIFTKFFEPK